MVSYKINDRWSFDSGISYSHLSSDCEEGSENNYIREEQSLHYIGIPIGATYQVLSWKNLELYLSARVTIVKCFSGQTHTNYIIEDSMIDQEINSIGEHPLQLSTGAMLGVQYKLTNQLSLYAKPGFSYYFDHKSSLETIYKDKPSEFNLNLGLRLTIGR